MSTTIEFRGPSRAKSASNHAAKRLLILGAQGPEDRFGERLEREGVRLHKSAIEVLQLNLGKMCNLTCGHCHVEAGPNRTEAMSEALLDDLLDFAKRFSVSVVDLTGGAPEMCPGFRRSVEGFSALGCEIIVRSNLTILLEPGYEDMVDYFAHHRVRVVASLPCYSEANVDKQRGDGVFQSSIAALQKLNAVGYGAEDGRLQLDLVYNPGGPSLPGPEKALEQAYKDKLWQDFQIRFNSLYAITNLPIGRFYSDLKKQGKAEQYDALLEEHFNVATVPRLMCRNTVNVSWDGWIYDCDFNQMVEMPSRLGGNPLHLRDLLALESLEGLPIQTGNHCFGCTAGAGSSCGGELV